MDLIKREDAIKAVAEPFEEELWDGVLRSIRDVVSVLKDIPSAENKGEWITDIYKLGKERHRCSECGKGSVEDSNFCPNCGCRMVKGADNGEI